MCVCVCVCMCVCVCVCVCGMECVQVNSSLELNLSQVDSNLRSVEERIAALQ